MEGCACNSLERHDDLLVSSNVEGRAWCVMSIWSMMGVIAGAGAVGGLLASLLSEDKGLPIPRFVKVKLPNGSSVRTNVLRPGFLGLMFVGAMAAALSWALYGPVANAAVLGTAAAGTSSSSVTLTLAVLAGAVVVGTGGSKWLSGQVDNVLLRQTATIVAGKPADASTASTIATASPSAALKAAHKLGG
jgi:hypothetical protein